MEEDLEKTQILNRSQETPINEPSEAAAAKTAKLPRIAWRHATGLRGPIRWRAFSRWRAGLLPGLLPRLRA